MTPTIRLYGISSSRALRCQWTLREIGLEYEHIPIDDHSGATSRPDYLAINPNGKVPCLVDGDLRLFESLAINLYLARRYGRELWPQTLGAEGQVYQWSFWALNEVENALMEFLYGRARADDVAMRTAISALAQPLGVLDDELRQRDYLIEGRFTIADLNTAASFSAGAFFDYDFSAWPNVHSWLQSCYGRAAANIPGSSLQRFREMLAI